MEGIELQSNLSMDQVREMFEVTRKLLRVRDVVLRVNRAYIRSAAQADAYRTEPPFKLQGSYRNMNRIAERVASVMNEAELQTLIVSSYEQDAQTLTTDNEANVLKFKELMGILSAGREGTLGRDQVRVRRKRPHVGHGQRGPGGAIDASTGFDARRPGVDSAGDFAGDRGRR